MLVSIHKLRFSLLILMIGCQSAKAQIWTLQRCIDTAQIHNKSLQISRNNLAIGEQRENEAKANLFPKVFANADYKYFINLPYQLMPLSTFNPLAQEGQFKEAQFGVPHNINANLQFSMPIYNSQIYGAIQTSKDAGELIKLQYKKTEEQVYFEITNLYYNAQILNHQLTFIDSNLLNAQKLLKNIQILNEQLLVKRTDVSKLKLQLAQIISQKENVNSKYIQVLNALKFAMGLEIKTNLQIETNIHYQLSNEISVTTSTEMKILNSQKQILTSEINILNKSKYLPSIYILGMYGTTGFGYDKQPNSFLNFYPNSFTGVQLSYPIFNGTVTMRKIKQKSYELKNNDIQYALLAEQNSMQIENAKLKCKNALNSINTSSIQIELAKTIFEQTVIQQNNGTASLTDILFADNSLREAQQTNLAAIIDYLKSNLELKKLTGNLSTNN